MGLHPLRMSSEFDEVWNELLAPGAAFEMVDIGGGRRAFRNAPADLAAIWRGSAAFGDRDYLIFEDERQSYAGAHAAVAAVAQWMHGRGIGPGDRIGIAMRNYPEWLLAFWATMAVGATAVGINALWTAPELRFVVEDSKPRIVFADAERVARLGGLSELEQPPILVTVRTPLPPPGAIRWEDIAAGGGALPDMAVDPEADACILYTSGTTGFPKGARQTHRSCVNNVMHVRFVAEVQRLAALRMGVPLAPVPAIPVGMMTTPLFHVSANNCMAQPTTLSGGTLVMMHRWDAGKALELIERDRVVTVVGVPAIVRELLRHPEYLRRDTSSLQTLIGGGSQLLPDVIDAVASAPGAIRPQTGFGMTEMSGIISSINGQFLIDRPLSCGRVLPTVDARVVDESSRPLPPGELGELWVRGTSMIAGYVNVPDEESGITADGWLRTGDLVRIDPDGFLYPVDRKKDMILRGGENIYCAEVEAALHADPDVAECCAFGVSDERLGEEVGAAVVAVPGATLDPEHIRAACAVRIAAYKVPRYLWILDSPLPLNASGKILKRQVRDELDPAMAR